MFYRLVIALVLVSAFALVGCSITPEKIQDFKLEPVEFTSLPGWDKDTHGDAMEAFRASCQKIMNGNGGASKFIGLTSVSWKAACQAIPVGDINNRQARDYFEKWFRPHLVIGSTGSEGLFTGYYEAELTGSLYKDREGQTPIYGIPSDHIRVDLGHFDPKLVGKEIVGRVENNRLLPYYSRGAIANGALTGKAKKLAWADDIIDLYTLHVQGSGRVRLRDGTVLRIGFAGHNGYEYRSIGKVLIKRGQLESYNASWPSIRDWIEKNPDKAKSLLAENARFIFFHEKKGEGPTGSHGVPLTAGRSIAIDKKFIPIGAPLWIVTHWPSNISRPLQKLVVAQDTGAAIKGPVRGDYFWGFGKEALDLAGIMKSTGYYFVLLPLTFD